MDWVPGSWQERLWSKIMVSNPEKCWPWMASKNKFGYGYFGLNGKIKKSHRMAYESVKGNIPEGLKLLHSCDNPSCCNPSHLNPGTQKKNVEEMYERGRDNQNPAFGSSHPNSKLCEKQVLEIRRLADDGAGTKFISEKFRISRALVYAIKKRLQWRHL